MQSENPAPSDRSSEELMRCAAAGDREAFGLLVERHHARALEFAGRFCADPELARDAVQESFLRMLRHAPRYAPRAQFTTYLFTVVRNAVREGLRRRRRRREDPFDPGEIADEFAADSSAGSDPEAALRRRRLGAAVQRALLALPEELREVFVLSEMSGLRYAEIARVCDCPEGTVASRKHAAVLRLRRLLDQEGITP